MTMALINSLLMRFRRWALVGAVGVGLGGLAPAAQAVESIQLTYGQLQLQPMELADWETFVAADTTTREIQALLDLMKVDNAIAKAIIGAEWEVDRQLIDRVADSFVANAFFELIGTAIDLPDADVADWLALRNATVAAAADGRLSVLEVLQNLEGRLLVIDTRRAIQIAQDIRQDIESIRTLFEVESAE